jgi:hypothetical protein
MKEMSSNNGFPPNKTDKLPTVIIAAAKVRNPAVTGTSAWFDVNSI